MSDLVTVVERYGRVRYRVYLGQGRTGNKHFYEVVPHDWYKWPSGEEGTVNWFRYTKYYRGYDPEHANQLIGFLSNWGWLTENDRAQAAAEGNGALVDLLEEMIAEDEGGKDKVLLRGVDLGRGFRPPLSVELLGSDFDRVAHRLAVRLQRQASIYEEPASPEQLIEAAIFIVEQVELSETD